MECDCISYNRPEPYQKTPSALLEVPHRWANEAQTVCVDACIADQVVALWEAGIWTLSTCCGHNGAAPRHVVVNEAEAGRAHAILNDRFSSPLEVHFWTLRSHMTNWHSSPQNDLELAIAEFKAALPGWWYSVCECQVSCDASCAPTVESEHVHLIQNAGDQFDAGFHVDLPQPSTLAQALRHVMNLALAAIPS